MLIAMRRVDTRMSAFFDLFNVFKTNLWLAILLTFIVNTILGIAYRMLERRFITNKPIASLEVSRFLLLLTILK